MRRERGERKPAALFYFGNLSLVLGFHRFGVLDRRFLLKFFKSRPLVGDVLHFLGVEGSVGSITDFF